MTNPQSLKISTSYAELEVPIIDALLYDELVRVEPSVWGKFEHRPCIVEDVDGNVLDCVYVAEAITYALFWGIDSHRSQLSISKVARIRESPTRLPIVLANKLYALGETCMGGVAFTIVMKDGRKAHGMSGNAVDFLTYPPGFEPTDVVDVLHRKSEGTEQFTSADYRWCLYGLPPDEAAEKIMPILTLFHNPNVTWRYDD